MRVITRVSNGLSTPVATIVAAIAGAVAAGHTPNDALGAWIYRNGGKPWTADRAAAARAMGFEIQP